MSIIVVGTNHKHSPIRIREQLAFRKNKIKGALVNMTSYKDIKAGVILSTCNRVELYATAEDPKRASIILKEFLADYHRKELNTIEPYLYTYIGKEAIRHLFRVASGLDSQITGESQILEQVRYAYQEARAVEATDRLLDTIFDNAIMVSLRVRQETGISEGKISIASTVAQLIKSKCGSIKNKKILIIGVGKISQLLTLHLKEEGARAVFIANRSYEKAFQIARSIGAEVARFDRLKEKLLDTDIIISATASPHLILRKEDILEVLGYRPSAIDHRQLLIIDLAVPRDVDPDVKYIKGVSLFCLDDLDFIIEDNLKNRKQSIPQALDIINKEVGNLCLSECLESEPEPVPLL